MFKLSMLYMATANDGVSFNPTTIDQGTGIHDSPVEMRARAEQQQAQQEETGSITPEDAEAPVTEEVQPLDQSGEQQEETPESDATEQPAYTYNGQAVEVTNKPEMVEAFQEKGINIDKVNAELFSEDGLTDATKAVLDEAFGKASVDMYLEGWAKQNEAALATAEAGATQVEVEQTKVLTDVAGDKHADVFKWANDNLSPEEYKEYADIINGDNRTAMKFAFKELTSRSGVMNPAEPAMTKQSPRATALAPDNQAPARTVEGLSQAQYLDLFTPNDKGVAEYWTDPDKYDALREVGRENSL